MSVTFNVDLNRDGLLDELTVKDSAAKAVKQAIVTEMIPDGDGFKQVAVIDINSLAFNADGSTETPDHPRMPLGTGCTDSCTTRDEEVINWLRENTVSVKMNPQTRFLPNVEHSGSWEVRAKHTNGNLDGSTYETGVASRFEFYPSMGAVYGYEVTPADLSNAQASGTLYADPQGRLVFSMPGFYPDNLVWRHENSAVVVTALGSNGEIMDSKTIDVGESYWVTLDNGHRTHAELTDIATIEDTSRSFLLFHLTRQEIGADQRLFGFRLDDGTEMYIHGNDIIAIETDAERWAAWEMIQNSGQIDVGDKTE